MAEPLVTINGIGIYSDKEMTGITNTKVTFADGSWCDTATREVVNQGRGYISIGSPGTADGMKPVVVGPRKFLAQSLGISDLFADVEVKVIDSDHMVVTIEGSQSQVDKIDVDQRGDQLVIKGKGGRPNISAGDVVISGRGPSIFGGIFSSMRGELNISTGSDKNKAKLTVGVPKGASIEVSDVHGSVVIGDTEGRLKASASTSKTVTAGRVKSAQLNADSGAKITVEEVLGRLVASANSGAKITVKDGDVMSLAADVSSGAKIKYLGIATEAKLDASSGGDIDVRHTRNRPQRHASSGGDITVGNW